MKDKTKYNGSVGREGEVLSSNFGGGGSGSESDFESGRSENQSLTFEQLRNCGVLLDSDFFERYGMVRGGRIYTNIAYLLSDQCEYTVKLNVFGGRSKIDFIDRTEFRGSVLKQCSEVCAYIGKRFSGAYPAVALYEAVSNSLIHRNYDYRGSVLINVYSDKLEISSIGGLVGDITVDDILVGISQPRNRLLAEFFYRYGTTTVCGAGIDRIVESYHNKTKKPVFKVTDNVFMTSEGLRIVFAQDVGDVIANGDVFTVEYKYIYYGLSFELPEEYKPPEPNPIDPKKEKVVALTFDDGPSGNVTPKLLKLLEKYDAKATFFVVGEMAETYPEVLKDILAGGHTLGLHTVNHTHLTKVSVDKAIKAVEDEAVLIEELTGKQVYYLRPPGGFINKSLAQTIGRPCIMWDVDPLDWKYRDAQKVSDAVLKNVTSGDIVLSHDLYQSTYEAYEIIIPELAKRGYRFVSLDELLGTTDPSIEGAYAGEIIYYRDLAIDLRADGKFNK